MICSLLIQYYITRFVKRVSEASSKVVGDDAGAGFVFCQTVACEMLPANNSKRDLEKLLE